MIMRKSEPSDLEFIMQPIDWPRWPLLPMVKRPQPNDNLHHPVCGFLFADLRPTVYLGYIYDPNMGKDGDKWGEVLARYKKVEYKSMDDVLENWRID